MTSQESTPGAIAPVSAPERWSKGGFGLHVCRTGSAEPGALTQVGAGAGAGVEEVVVQGDSGRISSPGKGKSSAEGR